MNFVRGTFRVRGDTVEIFPAHYEDRAWRLSLFGDELEAIHEFDPLTGEKTAALQAIKIYRQQPLCDAASRRCCRRSSRSRSTSRSVSTSSTRQASCSRRSGSSSAPTSTSR